MLDEFAICMCRHSGLTSRCRAATTPRLRARLAGIGMVSIPELQKGTNVRILMPTAIRFM